MPRDFELIRKLLMFFHDKLDPSYVEVPDLGAEYSEVQIKYHLGLLYQAGFLNCETVRSTTSDRVIGVLPFDLTWDGHEATVQIPMIVGFEEGGDWAPAGADDGSEPQ